MLEYNINHKEDEEIFSVILNGKESFLKYNLNDETMDILTTYVDPGLRGKGVAAALVEEGLKYARENNYKVIPTCSYVEVYLKRNDTYNDLIKNSN